MKVKPYVFHNEAGYWEVWLKDGRYRAETCTLETEVMVSLETGEVVGIELRDRDLMQREVVEAIDRKYRCDLCRTVFDWQELHGLYAVHLGWEKRDSLQCEHHICQTCLDSLSRIAAEYSAMRPTTNSA